MIDTERFDALAGILAYPEEGYGGRLDRCRRSLSCCEAARRHFDRFDERSRTASIAELQEDYTRTFDLDPTCSLEVGWHLFGENYSRGEFLVSMRRALRTYGLNETGELPDHLVHVLPVLARLDPKKVDGFVSISLVPALDKMLAALEGRDARYEELLRAVRAVVVEIKEAGRG